MKDFHFQKLKVITQIFFVKTSFRTSKLTFYKIPKNADFPKFCEYGSIFNEKTKNEEGLEAENLDFKADVL